jgi:hypothetical protein
MPPPRPHSDRAAEQPLLPHPILRTSSYSKVGRSHPEAADSHDALQT